MISNVKNERDLLTKNITIDFWDVIAAAFTAALITISALGFGWIAYYIVVALSSTTTFSSVIGIGISINEWLKVKENRSYATAKLKAFLTSNFAEEVKNISIESIKIVHNKIKHRLIFLFNGEIGEFEKMIQGQ